MRLEGKDLCGYAGLIGGWVDFWLILSPVLNLRILNFNVFTDYVIEKGPDNRR